MTQITILIIILIAFSIIFLIDIFITANSNKTTSKEQHARTRNMIEASFNEADYKKQISDLKQQISMLKIEIGIMQNSNLNYEKLIKIQQYDLNNERNSD